MQTEIFISYTQLDRAWAEWIAWVLEAGRISIVMQQWDFVPGSNFVIEMHRALVRSKKVIIILSPEYLASQFGTLEWSVGLAEDPMSFARKVVPVRVRECKLEGLLKPLVYIDLVNVSEEKAGQLILMGIRHQRLKPAVKPNFPGGDSSLPAAKQRPTFPGNKTSKIEVALHSPVTKIAFTKQPSEIVTTPRHISEIFKALRQSWQQYSLDLGAESAQTFHERAKVADEFNKSLAEVVSRQEIELPPSAAIIARGGYGRGLLSLGSDIDISFLHDPIHTKEAEAYYAALVANLSDLWKFAAGIRVSAIINTINECKNGWADALSGAPGGEATIAAFSYTRRIIGDSELHYSVRNEWNDFIQAKPWREFSRIASGLRKKADRTVAEDDRRFDIKYGAGGILEYRHCGFLSRIFDLRGVAYDINPTVDLSLLYLMRARDCAYLINRSHAQPSPHS